MTRLANELDIPRILELGLRFLREGPYRGKIKENGEEKQRLINLLLSSPNTGVVVSERNGMVTGVFAMVVAPHYLSGEPTASEVVWYVEPEARGDGLALLRHAEELAKEMGAKAMQLVAPDERAERLYALKKYERVEVSYQRRL